MKRLILALALALFAVPAFAQTVSCTGPTGANCVPIVPYTASGVINSGNPLPVSTQGTVTTQSATPSAGTAGAGYPPGATPVTASATATTAGATATLASASGKFTYICGFSVSPGSATTAITISVTVTGITNTFTEAVGAPVTAVGTTGLSFTRNFNPCVPSSAVTTGVAVAAGALGTGGVNQAVNAWGYQQ
jgi:hypothetical protein